MKPKKEMLYWLYNKQKDTNSTITCLEKIISETDEKLNAFIIVCNDNIEKTLRSYVPYQFKTDIKMIGDDVYCLSVDREMKKQKIGFKGPRIISGKALILKHTIPNIFVILSFESPYFVTHGLVGLIKQYKPYISKITQSSMELEQVLIDLEDKTKGEIISDKIVAYKRLEKKYETQIKRKSSVLYTNEPFRDSFQEALEKDEFIDKIDFRLTKDKKLVFNAFLSRDGIFRLDKNVKLFYDTVILKISEIGRKKFLFYKDRARIPSEGFKPKPFTIDFGFGVFENKEQNRRFIESLSELPNSSISVFHSNPYLHLSLLDYSDGSTCDIWIVTTERITIVPQIKSTFSSLQRVVGHIFEAFREGEIKEFSVDKDDDKR